MTASISPKRTALLAAARERILVLDGAMGTMIQGLQYDEAAFRGDRFKETGTVIKRLSVRPAGECPANG